MQVDHLIFRVGLVLLDRYELKVPLGEGGMGVVWKAIDRKLDAPVAIKFLKMRDEIAERRFVDECRIAARLSSPHVARVFDRGSQGGVPFLVMEYLEGQTLRELLLIRGTLTPEQVTLLVEQTATGLAAVHERGIVHRDIKPANLFLLEQGSRTFVKILDFGASKIEAGEWTEAGGWLGTPHYVSPEQARDASEADLGADVWALAVVAYECLTGRKPFDGASATAVLAAILDGRALPPASMNSRLPPQVDAVFASAFSRDRKERPQSADAFAHRLRRALSQSTGAASAVSEVTVEFKTGRRARRSFVIASFLALALATYAGYRFGAYSKHEGIDVSRRNALQLFERKEKERETKVPSGTALDVSEPSPASPSERPDPPPHPSSQGPSFTPSSSERGRARSAHSGGSGPQTSASSDEDIWEKRR